MRYQGSVGAIALAATALAAALSMTLCGARAADNSKYPDWKGQ